METIYAYAGDLYCDTCVDDIIDELKTDGRVDTGDSGDYPQGNVDSETDAPSHCAHCHEPLKERLTEVGVAYVVEKVKERLRTGTAPGDWRWPHGYYKGMDRNAVLRDWAGELLLASLEPADARAVALFLFWTRPERGQKAA